ncbi:MAG: hypothetical protein JSV35_05045 [Candidatus Bathyarchaeota archaeon]|nr:MAG: hypothetical protein JSV35_05045 [Candidatus Bathyarchaeota archaeon]
MKCSTMTDTSEDAVLLELKLQLSNIEKKLDEVLDLQKKQLLRTRSFIPTTIASLPEHLKRTATIIAAVGDSTAEQIAEKTGRARAAESDYLNQLADRGLLIKERVGRAVHFKPLNLYTECPNCRAIVLPALKSCAYCGSKL